MRISGLRIRGLSLGQFELDTPIAAVGVVHIALV
jgi:hypothetical protein